jgi:hypothetical protein
MAYFVDQTIPVSTPKSAPFLFSLDISPLVIDRIEIVFPDGCVYLAGLRIKYRAIQIFPYNDSVWFIGNGNIIRFDTEFECLEPPYALIFEYFNEDDTFTHRLVALIDVTFVNIDNTTVRTNIQMQNGVFLVPPRR